MLRVRGVKPPPTCSSQIERTVANQVRQRALACCATVETAVAAPA